MDVADYYAKQELALQGIADAQIDAWDEAMLSEPSRNAIFGQNPH